MGTATLPGRIWPFFLGVLFLAAAPAPVHAAETKPACAAMPEIALLARNAAGRILLTVPVRIGERFSIVFTHSLALSRVEEVFAITSAEEFRLRETIYEDFGAGLPHEETPEQRLEFRDGHIRRDGYDMAFRELQLRVGHIADHHLIVGAAAPVRLADLERPGGQISLSVGMLPAASE